MRYGYRRVEVIAERVVDIPAYCLYLRRCLSESVRCRVSDELPVCKLRRLVAFRADRSCLRSCSGCHLPQVLCRLHHPPEPFLCGLQGLVAEIKRAPVVRLQDEEPHCHRAVRLGKKLVRPAEKLLQGDEVPQ